MAEDRQAARDDRETRRQPCLLHFGKERAAPRKLDRAPNLSVGKAGWEQAVSCNGPLRHRQHRRLLRARPTPEWNVQLHRLDDRAGTTEYRYSDTAAGLQQ